MSQGPDRGSSDPAAWFDGEALGLVEGLMFALDVCLSDIEPGETLELASTNLGLQHELGAWSGRTGHHVIVSE